MNDMDLQLKIAEGNVLGQFLETLLLWAYIGFTTPKISKKPILRDCRASKCLRKDIIMQESLPVTSPITAMPRGF